MRRTQLQPRRNIPFQSLSPSQGIREELNKAYHRVINSGVYLFGRENESLSREFLSYIGEESLSCVCVNSGFDALQISMRALGIGRNDTVIVPANAPIPVYMAVSITGARPIPVDIELFSYNISAEAIEKSIDNTTKAIVVVHLYGRPYDYMDWIGEIAANNGVYVIEDCSQAHGAKIEVESSYSNPMVGAWGDVAAFSFYPTKNMGAIGDAGIVLVQDDDVAKRIENIKFYGGGEMVGVNSRMDELQAAFLRVKLQFLDQNNEKRKQNAEYYLANFPNKPAIVLPSSHPGHVWHQFVILHEERTAFMQHLHDCGIETMIHYPTPPYRMKAYGYTEGMYSCPNTDYFADRCVSIPIAPHLEQEDLEYIVECVEEFRP